MKSTKSYRRINLTAYEGFERLNTFKGGINAYRTAKILSAQGHVDFVRHLFGDKKIMVIELGSGNSRTLYALEEAGLLNKGYGIEVSKSRHQFAERWKKSWNFKHVKNINANAADFDPNAIGRFDLGFCVDVAFQFFEPMGTGIASRVLCNIYRSLNTGGFIVLELSSHANILGMLNNNRARFWEEFLEPDPWKYSLWDCQYDPANKFLKLRKIFVRRNGSGFSENCTVLKIYGRDAMVKLLNKSGFRKISFYQGWDLSRLKDCGSEFIVVGKK